MEEQLEAAGVTETIGSDRFDPSVRAAVAACVSAQEARPERFALARSAGGDPFQV
jgi:hypothetical protein